MQTIQIQQTINASIERTWDYYTSPSHIINWNFASDDWCCPSADNDLKIGGIYKARMEAKDKSFGFDFEATYTQIEPYQSFQYQIADGRLVDVKFDNVGNQTTVTIIFEAETINPIDLQQKGWQAILDNFKKYTEDK